MTNQYRVLKDLINAPVGTILSKDISSYMLKTSSGETCLYESDIKDAVNQGFIEPYTPEPKHWRAEPGEFYWHIDEDIDVIKEIDDITSYDNCYDNFRYITGNYFKSQATAELVAKAQKLFFEYLHTIPGTPQQNIKNDFEKAHAEARKAVLEDDSNE